MCAGITLPLITRILLGRGAGERAIGQVYAVNTLGSILGAALAGLVLMPVLGLKWLLVSGALLDVGLGLWLLARHESLAEPGATAVPATRRGRAAWLGQRARADAALFPTAIVTLGGLLLVAVLTPFSSAVLTSGVYRYASVSDPRNYVVPFYRDGRTATVSVRRHVDSRMLTLATNGKPDASLALEWIRPGPGDTVRKAITGDQVTQALLPLVMLAHAPTARTAAVIGQGSGMTSHLLLGSPALRELSTIDIEPEMIRGSRQFYPANRRVFDDPRAHFVVDDAKAFFASSRRTFDLIVSEPSNPWVSGVSGLFTDEFYHRVRGYLAPRGVFGQWLHLYEIDDALVLSVLGAIHRNFPSYQIYMVSTADIFVVASNAPQLAPPDWRVVALPAIAQDLAPLAAARLGHARRRARARPRRARARCSTVGPRPTRTTGRAWTSAPSGRDSSSRRRAGSARCTSHASTSSRRCVDGAWASRTRRSRRSRCRASTHARAARRSARGGTCTPPEACRAPTTRRPSSAWTAGRRPGCATRSTSAPHWNPCWRPDARPPTGIASSRSSRRWRRRSTAAPPASPTRPSTAACSGTSTRRGAPAPARAAVTFLHGLAVHDFVAAANAADVLVQALQRRDQWVETDVLHDGSIVAAIRLGDAERATRMLAATAAAVARTRDDVRSELLTGWIEATARRSPRPARTPAGPPVR